jgi:hypothetical protein
MPLHGHALYEQIIVKGGENCESPMDRHMCLSGLRVLAKSNRPDRGALVERHIDEYLKIAPFSFAHEVERLRRAIQNEEAQHREGEDWSPARDYVGLLLHSMALYR